MPNPVALADCYTINPFDEAASWQSTDSLPNGPQTMSDGILLPDGTVLIINGARTGSGGGFMADDPVYEPVIYNPSAPAGSRFQTILPATAIPRLYHSAAVLLPSGEVLVSGSNPAVGYSPGGGVPGGLVISLIVVCRLTISCRWPYFGNNGHQCALVQQQRNTSFYPTEYRVEIFSPPYISAPSRPT